MNYTLLGVGAIGLIALFGNYILTRKEKKLKGERNE